MQAEVVAVPTRGVERWLTQRLSAVLGASPGRADGVCANVEFPFPGRLVNGAVATAAGVDRERIRGCRSGRSGRCSTWSSRRSASPGWRRWRRTSVEREPMPIRPGVPAG